MKDWKVILVVSVLLVLACWYGYSQEGAVTKTDTDVVSVTEPVEQQTEQPMEQLTEDSSSPSVESTVTPPVEQPKAASHETSDLTFLMESGKKWMQEGNIRLASFYFANAIGKYPGNMDVIAAYRDSLLNAAKQTEDTETRYGYWAALELFLQNQIMNVSGNEVETLAKWLDEITATRNQMEETASEEATAENTDESDDETEDIPAIFAELKTSLDEQSGYIQNTLKLAESDARQLDIASYQLQECEQIMRGIIALQPKLSDEQKKEIPTIYTGLQTLSETVVDTKSKRIWEQYIVSHKEFLTKLDEIRTFNNTPESSSSGPLDGTAEKRMKLLRKQMGELQKILPNLSEKYVGDMDAKASLDTASGRLQQMQKLMLEATEMQQKKYNQWAMGNIRQCLKEAKEGVRLLTNGTEKRTKVSDALVTYIAPIDQRFLTSEVTRVYQEVEGKYLAELHNVEDEDSFDEIGNKIHTLKRMFETKKIQLSQF